MAAIRLRLPSVRSSRASFLEQLNFMTPSSAGEPSKSPFSDFSLTCCVLCVLFGEFAPILVVGGRRRQDFFRSNECWEKVHFEKF